MDPYKVTTKHSQINKDDCYQILIKKLKDNKNLIIEGANPLNDQSYKWVQENDDILMIEKGIPLFDFQQGMQKRNLEREYRLLRRLTESQHHQVQLKDFLPELSKMNRYSNILPFKHTEVQVKYPLSEREEEHYVNANRLNTCLGDEGYLIATQGPLPKTFFNFYRMVLEQQNGKQCDRYYPKTKDQLLTIQDPFDNDQWMEVQLLNEQELKQGLIERELFVQLKNKTQTIQELVTKQVNWLNWPDHGVPDGYNYYFIQDILDLMVNSYIYQPQKKIIIHCSAGIGRTGTLLCLFDLTLSICSQLAMLNTNQISKQDCRLTVFGTVRRLREQRWGLLTSASQYQYIYNFINSFIQQITKNVKL